MKRKQTDRRTFLRASAVIPLTSASLIRVGESASRPASGREKNARIKLSCNLFSFNDPLSSGRMALEEVFELCADLGFDAVDPTAYYFPNYPDLPNDEYVYRVKRKAFRLSLDISGTGVRNDFTLPDSEQRKAEIEMVKKWVGFAARFGAPALRVFSGKGVPEGHSKEEVNGWVVEALRECANYGGKHGVMIVLQNHADFIQTAEQVLQILRMVNSEWLAVNLDIGSFRIGDPYAEVAKVAPYAATWQVKENMFVNGKEEKTDLSRILRIVQVAGYRGYLPLETLGEGDPRVKVPRFLSEVRKALAVGV